MANGSWKPAGGDEYLPCLHRPEDFPLIKKVLELYKPLWVVELGTYKGGFSAFLADQIRDWGGQLLTLDNTRHKEVDRLLTYCPNVRFLEEDVLNWENPNVLSYIVRPRAFLYCDNGDKNREVEFYAKYLDIGGLLGVHDYGTEADPEFINKILASLRFRTVFKKKFEELSDEWYKSLTRIWVRRIKRRAICLKTQQTPT